MRVLVVEDEPKIGAALKKGLGQEGYAVDLAITGPEGYGFASTEPYDLIILDRMLPGGEDGLNICRRLREQGIHIPVLMLTAKDRVPDRVSGLNGGADDYMIKPFDFSELVARVRALLRRPQVQTGTILSCGNLTMDTVVSTVHRSETLIQLSAREYSLLEYLLRNQGRPISKDELISHVWDFDADVLPNTVEVYVGYLRSKLEEGTAKFIHTVRGFGYKMEKI